MIMGANKFLGMYCVEKFSKETASLHYFAQANPAYDIAFSTFNLKYIDLFFIAIG